MIDLRRQSRRVAVAAVLANVLAIGINVTVAVAGGMWANLAMVPVGIFAIGVVVAAWRRYGRNLPSAG